MEEPKAESSDVKKQEPSSKKHLSDKLFIILIVVLLIVCGLLAWWYWQLRAKNQELDKTNKDLQSKVTSLTQQVTDKTKEADDAKAAAVAKTATTTTTTTTTAPSAALKENVEAAISSKNTAALEGYMASSVNVVYAASEKAGARTPAQAISDLDYLNSATSPWNFALPAATLTTYKNGFYGQYFGTNTIVGRSANKYVASFGVNSSNKIDTIFITVSEDLLK